MLERLEAAVDWLFLCTCDASGKPAYLWTRWLFLRGLGLIYFSAFYSLLFQIRGLIGPNGILPAADYLQAVSVAMPAQRFWFAPSLFWMGASNLWLMAVTWIGIVASLLVILNLWPRASLTVCFVCFLSFIGVAQDFSSYQSDGMLLEAGFFALFFAPAGLRPGLGLARPPSRASLFLLRWEWFRIYFESGIAKIRSGDIAWRNFTAMDDYYQNGPLPTWIGWYVQHLPHWFHAFASILTLAMELLLVWMLFLPRRIRIICFCLVTPFQIVIILTANYAFLNYIVLLLGFLLLDDRALEWILPAGFRAWITRTETPNATDPLRQRLAPLRRFVSIAALGLAFYASAVQLLWMLVPSLPFPDSPIRALEPFRVADRYGLFAVMTHQRYEIEFQGTLDGRAWTPYPFRYKPQDLNEAPGIYAPYQPRFDWNLWFASLGEWHEYKFVVWTEERLLKNEPGVAELFKSNPFAAAPPVRVRTVLYQYWFTDLKTKRETGNWWRRELVGEYAPALEREPNGKIGILEPQGTALQPQDQ
jgi:hypothetical protein